MVAPKLSSISEKTKREGPQLVVGAHAQDHHPRKMRANKVLRVFQGLPAPTLPSCLTQQDRSWSYTCTRG